MNMTHAMNANFYRSLYRIRRVEEEIAKVYPSDKIQSPIHLSIGQESVSVGVCEALEKNDTVFGTYRGHALYLAKGGDLTKLICELYGKAGGCCHGKGGSLHLAALDQGFMGTSAVVASGIPHAVGFAYALKLKKSRSIAVSFFGDGATEEGVFFESLNFATLKKLPVLFICENNGLAVHARQSERQSVPDIAGKAAAFGIPTEVLDGHDLNALYQKTKETVAQIREGAGPHFFEIKIGRWMEHVGPGEDFKFGYRSLEEIKPWKETDPVSVIRKALKESEVLQIEREVDAEIADAFRVGEESPVPAPEELFTDVVKE